MLAPPEELPPPPPIKCQWEPSHTNKQTPFISSFSSPVVIWAPWKYIGKLSICSEPFTSATVKLGVLAVLAYLKYTYTATPAQPPPVSS